MPTKTGKRDHTVSQSSGFDDNQDLRLLKRVADRDRQALSLLYRSYYARLFKFVFRLTNSYTAAEELVNDVMLLVWRKADTFRAESKVSTWILGIAYRLAMRRLKRQKTKLAPMAFADESSFVEDSQEMQDWVEVGLQSLSPAHRLTVTLVFYLGLSYEETAAVTGCPVNTVKTRMYHARHKLKEALTKAAGED